ncbi:hypothetical protein [Ralstonia pseudosolanacearum]|uniref:hypothetical protein n=1 Tax=Ralstonia pseudosolanacearum TaxID=1310165 RepID=UPI0026760B28|nr:hypothetical protein [Ralstonia pseudosolanacearum]MDO3607414.1 hypothetical protein [Ralstonia pseudosolanacearum]MDO3609837.1 hypothetical protein [Ralstonia pseudosolanacearum]
MEQACGGVHARFVLQRSRHQTYSEVVMGPMGGFNSEPWALVIGVAIAIAFVFGLASLAVFAEGRISVRRREQWRRSAWREHVRESRCEFFDALAVREEAYRDLDGGRLEVADELARFSLQRLGGLAGAW